MGIDKNGYPFVLDETAEIINQMAVSAGQRGLQLVFSGPDLVTATGARLTALTR